MARGYDFLRVFRSTPVNIISPVLHTNSCIINIINISNLRHRKITHWKIDDFERTRRELSSVIRVIISERSVSLRALWVHYSHMACTAVFATDRNICIWMCNTHTVSAIRTETWYFKPWNSLSRLQITELLFFCEISCFVTNSKEGNSVTEEFVTLCDKK